MQMKHLEYCGKKKTVKMILLEKGTTLELKNHKNSMKVEYQSLSMVILNV